MIEELVKRVSDLESMLSTLSAQDIFVRLSRSTNNVSNPPTDSETDTAFGQPSDSANFVGIIDDEGNGVNVWLVYSNGTNWYYEQLTKAV